MSVRSPYVIARESNIVRVDFRRRPDPPAPKFPGAAALRRMAQRPANACGTRLNAEAA